MAVRVYLVDHNLYNRSILHNILITHGFSVCGQSSLGQDAIENYERLRPDVVIVTATLPTMDGVATIKTLKYKYPEVSVIFSASAGQRSAVVEALSAGAVDFIAKPYSARRVIATLRKHFG